MVVFSQAQADHPTSRVNANATWRLCHHDVLGKDANLSRPAERMVAFYNERGTAEQHIKEGKNAVRWTRLSWVPMRNTRQMRPDGGKIDGAWWTAEHYGRARAPRAVMGG